MNMPSTIKEDTLEKYMLSLPQVECPMRHIFGPGVYIREILIKAGTMAISNYHKGACLNTMVYGNMMVMDEEGQVTKTLTGPCTFVSPPGRKIGYAVEDTLWQNIHSTDLTDIDEIEKELYDFSEEYTRVKQDNFNKLQDSACKDREDFKQFLLVNNYDEDEINKQVEDMSDHIDLPSANYKFELKPSPIQGNGIFATAPIQEGEIIGPGRLDMKRTILGRRMNHSNNPNCIVVGEGQDIWIRALRDISGKIGGGDGEELTLDYGYTIMINKQITVKE